MAQLVGFIVSDDDAFKKEVGRLARAGAIPVSVIDDRAARDGAAADIIIVDVRGDAASAMSNIERLRSGSPGAAIFAVALDNNPDVILQSMRAGANEFFTWPPAEEAFHSAVRRAAAPRRRARAPAASTRVVVRAKG